ncbi:MAG: GNAT family N-acetyltransferase [Pirellulales bacterium]
MRTVRHTFELGCRSGLDDFWLDITQRSAISIESLDVHRDAVKIRGLVAACRISRQGMTAKLTAAGLLGECTSRPDRNVSAWLARADTIDPAGLVTLTVVTAGVKRRFSIGWLLVAPAARRRGVATALACRALVQAQAAGASEVHVETLESWTDADAFWQNLAARLTPEG